MSKKIPKKQFIEVIVVNIAANPHPEGTYFDLFQKAAGQEVTFAANGEKKARFSKPQIISDHINFFSGHLFTWTGIDKNKNWTNLNNEEPLSDAEKDENLKAIDELSKSYALSGERFNYVFNIQDHKLYIERKNSNQRVIMPNQIKAILKKIMSLEIQGENAPNVEITILPESGMVDHILELPGLKKLSISIVKPNPDDTSDVTRAKVFERINNQKASKFEYTLHKEQKEESLIPDQETKDLANIAAEDGLVRGEGVDTDGKITKLSTEDKPRIIQLENDPHETLLHKLHRLFSFW